MTYSCKYKGVKERCLLKNGFPVTKNGKISKKRVRAAETYGSKTGRLETLKKNGLCFWVRKAGVKNSKVCK